MLLHQTNTSGEFAARQVDSVQLALVFVTVLLHQTNTSGEFAARQCSASTGFCYCAPSSNKHFRRVCSSSLDNVQLALVFVTVLLHQTNTSGEFAARQCSASTGFCYCATETGEVIEGTRYNKDKNYVCRNGEFYAPELCIV